MIDHDDIAGIIETASHSTWRLEPDPYQRDRDRVVVGDWQGARFAAVEQLLAAGGVTMTEQQRRSMRWLCGDDIPTIANIVDLILQGRGTS